jgi:hypothetical protein
LSSIPSKSRGSSVLHSVQTGSEAHPVSYPTGTGGSLPGSKATTLFPVIRGKGKIVSVFDSVHAMKTCGGVGYISITDLGTRWR